MNDRVITFREAIQEAIYEEMCLDESIVIIGEDVLATGRKSSIKFPTTGDIKRVWNHIPLVEDMLGGIALGMSIGGLRPVVQFDYPTFVTHAFESIYRLGHWRYRTTERDGPGVVIRVALEGFVSGGPDISKSFIGTVMDIPNVSIVIPSTPYYVKGLLKMALRINQPTLFFETKKLYRMRGIVPTDDYTISYGVSEKMAEGTHVSLISWGYARKLTIDAETILKREGISADVIVLQTLKPLDSVTILASARKTKNVVVVDEEGGSAGARIVALVAEHTIGCRVRIVSPKNIPPPPWEFAKYVLPTVADVVEACKNTLN